MIGLILEYNPYLEKKGFSLYLDSHSRAGSAIAFVFNSPVDLAGLYVYIEHSWC